MEIPPVQQILHLFNFGACIKQWVKILYINTECTVWHNGFTTNFSRGVRQGYPLSPYLFIPRVEQLPTRIREQCSLGGIKIFGKELKISHLQMTLHFLKQLNFSTKFT